MFTPNYGTFMMTYGKVFAPDHSKILGRIIYEDKILSVIFSSKIRGRIIHGVAFYSKKYGKLTKKERNKQNK